MSTKAFCRNCGNELTFPTLGDSKYEYCSKCNKFTSLDQTKKKNTPMTLLQKGKPFSAVGLLLSRIVYSKYFWVFVAGLILGLLL